jgi:hypothetical protein
VGDGELVFGLQRPTNPTIAGRLTVRFSLPNASPAHLELLDIAGRRVSSREVGSLGAGAHQVSLGEVTLPSGIYFVRLTQGTNAASMRVALAR